MALNTCTVAFFFILSTFIGDAHNVNPPAAVNKPIMGVAPATSECAKKYIEEHLETTAGKSRDFLLQEIRKRLNDRSTTEDERKCLMSCYQAYQDASDSIARGINDVSRSKYVEAVQDVVEYLQNIASCWQCSMETVLKDTEFVEFQKWAKNSAVDLQNKLKSCN